MAQGQSKSKVILLGEHAVVHGVPALVAGLEKGAIAQAEKAKTFEVSFGGEVVPADHDLMTALCKMAEVLSAPPCRLTLSLEVPAGAGLGASAALGVATARALSAMHGDPTSERRIAAAVDEWESVFHGNPSGVDRAAAQMGGVLQFVRGEDPEPVGLRAPLPLVVALADPPANTRVMVEGVARLKTTNPEQFQKNLDAIRSLVENALVCLRSGDLLSLGKLMNLNQMVLAGWMVSTEGIERACATAREAGALGAKLTGSGGGGCIVALCTPEGRDSVRAALEREGFEAFSSTIRGPDDQN